MFDQSKLKMQYRPRLPGMNFTRKRPGFQKRMEPPPIPRQLNKPLSKKFTNIPTKPILQTLTIKPTPTFKSKVVPTFTSYSTSHNNQKKRLSCPTVRPTRTLNKLPTKSMLSPRHTPETPESGFVSQEPTCMALKTKSSKQTRHVTRQKRKLPRDDDEYRPKLKKRRTRKLQQPSLPNYDQAKFEQPNYKWRDKDKISVPDIFELTSDQWPEDSEDEFVETLNDTTNEAFYVRHYRAEQREKIFYQKLQKWRDKDDQAFQREKKLRVADRPRGPWQVKLPKSIERGPQHVPQEILSEPRFNYNWHGKWTQPVTRIRRLVRKTDQKPRTRQEARSEESSRSGKDLDHLRYYLHA